MSISKNVKYWRIRRGLTQRQLAILIESSQGYISDIEKGIKIPTIRTIEKLSTALDICVGCLLKCDIGCNECTKEYKCIFPE